MPPIFKVSMPVGHYRKLRVYPFHFKIIKINFLNFVKSLIICQKPKDSKEAFSGLYWRNRLKLGTDETEVLNVFFGSARAAKGKNSSYKVSLVLILKGTIQGRDFLAENGVWVKDSFRELEPCKSMRWTLYIQGWWELACVIARQL